MKEQSYSDLKKSLGEIITWFESEDVDLDQALEKYSQAEEIIKKMEKYLQKVDQKINKKV